MEVVFAAGGAVGDVRACSQLGHGLSGRVRAGGGAAAVLLAGGADGPALVPASARAERLVLGRLVCPRGPGWCGGVAVMTGALGWPARGRLRLAAPRPFLP